MALCYINGMLSPPSLADSPTNLANNYSVTQIVSVVVGTSPWGESEALSSEVAKGAVVLGYATVPRPG